MQKNGKLYHYPLVLDTKKGGLSLLFIYVKYNASSAYMPYSASALLPDSVSRRSTIILIPCSLSTVI